MRRYLPHTADVRVVLEAPTLPVLLEEATATVRDLIVGTSDVRPEAVRRVNLTAGDAAELVFRYVRELLYLFATERFVPGYVRVITAGPERAEVELHGELFDAARHETQPEVKAVTRHLLDAKGDDNGWRAQLVFDL